MSLPTNLTKPNTLIAGTDALAADVNGDLDYILAAQNASNTQTNANTDEIVAGRGGTSNLNMRFSNVEIRTTDLESVKSPLDSPTFIGTVTIPAGASIVGYAPLASPTFTGTPTVPTANAGTSTTQAASTAFVQTAAFNTALPAQTGNAGKFVTTDGTNASWGDVSGFVTPTGTETLSNKTLTLPTITGSTDTVYSLSGTTPAISAANGNVQQWTLSAASSPTDSLAAGQSIMLLITAGAYAVTWPSVTWSKAGGSGAAPTLSATGKSAVILWKVATTLYGSYLGDV